MSDQNYLITHKNFYSTNEKLFSSLSSRGIKLKKSDLKEALSALIGFDTSNILDAKLKAESHFDKIGRHKFVDNLILHRSKNPLDVFDEINKKKTFDTIIHFSDDFQATGGYQYETDHVLLAKNKYDAVKTILNWDAVTKLEYKYLKDEGPGGYLIDHEEIKDGYWLLTLNGEGDQRLLGTYRERYMDSYQLNGEKINHPSTPKETVSKFFIDHIIETTSDQYFFVEDKTQFQSFLHDWIKDFYFDTRKVNDESEFSAHIERFLTYIPIDKIAEMEVDRATIPYIEILHEHGADLKKTTLLYNSVCAGNLEVADYLIDKGNDIKGLYSCGGWSDLSGSYYHEESHTYGSYDSNRFDKAKIFYNSIKELGLSMNIQDVDGNTPLHHAAKFDNEKLYDHLITLGADSTIKNCHGESPSVLIEKARKREAEMEKQWESTFDSLFADILS